MTRPEFPPFGDDAVDVKEPTPADFTATTVEHTTPDGFWCCIAGGTADDEFYWFTRDTNKRHFNAGDDDHVEWAGHAGTVENAVKQINFAIECLRKMREITDLI